MIKFFRKIRQTLIHENRFSKYLLYALGEIMLVVIGILIALQINNWNEDRKQDQRVKQNYHQILEDLEREKNYATFIIDKFEGQRKAYQEYLDGFSTSQITREAMLHELLQLNMEGFPINSNSSFIESLHNSGEIALVPEKIRNRLIDLRRRQQKIIVDEGLDNRARMGIIERVSMLIGTKDLEKRIESQAELRAALNLGENTNQIIMGLEAIHDWMDFSESKSIRHLKELVTEIEEVESLIMQELESK